MPELSDQEFVNALRAASLGYLEAVDRWEAAYRKHYRMPGEGLTVSSDMAAEQQEYEAQRHALQLLLPRAHRLCLKHQLRNPFAGLIRITLGQHAPQHGMHSAIGRSERNAVMECLVQFADACNEWPAETPQAIVNASEPPKSKLLTRRSAILAGTLGTLAGIGITFGLRPSSSRPPVSAVPVPAPPEPPKSVVSSAGVHFYRMEGRPLTSWGDYNDILQHGMTAHLERTRGLLSLERTGPYIPPITYPGIGDVLLTTDARKMLESSGLSGFTFQPVYKARIVALNWNYWDLKLNEPPQFPASGEPEDYILDRPTSSSAADAMGDVWELVVPVTAKIGRARESVQSFRELYVLRDSWNGADIFRGEGYRSPLVTARAKAWIEEHFARYVLFEEFAAK